MEIYKEFRPKLFKGVIGQDEAVKTLTGMIRNKAVPHSLLFRGPTGCGKTTCAYILRDKLGITVRDCEDTNVGAKGGIDKVREIQRTVTTSPHDGPLKMYILDEVGEMTQQAQKALLKTLEAPYTHVHWVLCTMDPEKLHPSIVNRTQAITFRRLSRSDLTTVLESVSEKSGWKMPSDLVLEKILDCANGIPRQVIQDFNRVANLESEEDQLEALNEQGAEKSAKNLVDLMVLGDGNWSKVARVIEAIEAEPENVRKYILATAANRLLTEKDKGRLEYLFAICDVFEVHWKDLPGKAGLVMKSYQITRNRK